MVNSASLPTLLRSVSLLEQGQAEAAKELLIALVNEQIDIEAGLSDRLAFLCALALFRRLERTLDETENLYSRAYHTSQSELFSLYASHAPHLVAAYQLANQHIGLQLSKWEHPVLIDIGVGAGQQVAQILAHCREQGHPLSCLKVIGVDPSQTHLDEARNRLERMASLVECALEFVPIKGRIQALDAALWDQWIVEKEQTLVNASFSLHQLGLSSEGLDDRDIALKQIAHLEPSAVVLCESNIELHHVGLQDRLSHTWHYLTQIFSMLEGADLTENEAHLLSIHFFGRVLEDILGAEEASRWERYESVTSWGRRLQNAGWSLPALSTLATPLVTALPHKVIDIVTKEHHIAIDFQGNTLVGIWFLDDLGGRPSVSH